MLYKLMFHIDFKNIGTTLVCFQGAGGGGGGGGGEGILGASHRNALHTSSDRRRY